MIKRLWVLLFVAILPVSSFATEGFFEDPHDVTFSKAQKRYTYWQEHFSNISGNLNPQKLEKMISLFLAIPLYKEDLTSTPYVPTPEDLESFDSDRFSWWRSQKTSSEEKGTVEEQIQNACRILGNKIYTNRIDCSGKLHDAQQYYTQYYRIEKKLQKSHGNLLQADTLEDSVFDELDMLQREYFKIETTLPVLFWQSIVANQIDQDSSDELQYSSIWDSWGNTTNDFGLFNEGLAQKWRKLYVNAMRNSLWPLCEVLINQEWTNIDVAQTIFLEDMPSYEPPPLQFSFNYQKSL